MLFSHAAGQIAIAPVGTGKPVTWAFTRDTVQNARNLFVVIEDLPTVQGWTLPQPHSTFFALRRFIRGVAPWLLTDLGSIKLWQVLGWAGVLLVSLAIGRSGMNKDGIDLDVKYAIDVRQGGDETAIGNKLMLDILGLCETLGVRASAAGVIASGGIAGHLVSSGGCCRALRSKVGTSALSRVSACNRPKAIGRSPQAPRRESFLIMKGLIHAVRAEALISLRLPFYSLHDARL